MRHLVRALCVLGVALLSGCVTNPITGRSQLSIVPESTAINQATSQYNTTMETLRSQGKIVDDKALNDRVHGITDRIVQQAVQFRPDAQSWAWEVQIINDPKEANAFCAAGGKMAIYTGLLKGLDLTDDEVAQVMAHEVSHALLGHSAEKASMGVIAAVLTAAAAATARTAYDQDLRRLGADAATDLFMELPNSRGTEAEADQVGIELAARAGFNPQAAVSVWQKMTSSGNASTSRFDLLNTHPASPKRIEALSAMVDSMSPIYLAARPADAGRANTQLAAQRAPQATDSGSASMSLDAMCALPSLVDREECLGRIQMGMTKDEVLGALGQPNDISPDGTVLRYSDRFLQLDGKSRLTGITDRRPQ